MNYSCTRKLLLLFSTIAISTASFSQSENVQKQNLDSLLVHKWAVVVSSEEELKNAEKKPLLVDFFPAELPNTIEFFSNGSFATGGKKGSWQTTAAKDVIQIVVDGKSSSYRVTKSQNKKLKLHELNSKKILLLTQID